MLLRSISCQYLSITTIEMLEANINTVDSLRQLRNRKPLLMRYAQNSFEILGFLQDDDLVEDSGNRKIASH